MSQDIQEPKINEQDRRYFKIAMCIFAGAIALIILLAFYLHSTGYLQLIKPIVGSP